jgi:hypothetical protein
VAKLTLADMQTQVWDDILDVDSANRALDSTTLTRILNRALVQWKGMLDDRVYTVAAVTSGASTSSAGQLTAALTPTNIRRILNVYPATGGASVAFGGPALSRMEPWEIRAMQWEDNTALAADGFATAYAVTRQGTATAASVGKWNLHLWRVPQDTNTRYYVLEYLQEVTALSGSTDKADITEAEDQMLCDMAAFIGARRLGRPEEFIASIGARIAPEQQAVAEAVAREFALDRDRPGEDAA